MLSYEALLFAVVFSMVTVSHQYELAVKNIQEVNNSCPAVEVRVDDVTQLWQTNTVYDSSRGCTIARLTPNKCAKKNSTTKTPDKCPPPETVCPSKEALMALGYELLPGFRYYKILQGTAKNYEDAMKLCEREGSHLLVLTSDDEAKALNAYLKRLSLTGWFFAGFNDQDEEGVYRTIYGKTTTETGFDKKFPYEFNGNTLENCGIYRYSGIDYGLGDIACSTPSTMSICQRDDL